MGKCLNMPKYWVQLAPMFKIVPKKMNEMIHSKTWFIHIGNMYEAKND